MKVSFLCRHCGVHLRKGDHRACKRILRAQDPMSEEAREKARLRSARRDPARLVEGLPSGGDSGIVAAEMTQGELHGWETEKREGD